MTPIPRCFWCLRLLVGFGGEKSHLFFRKVARNAWGAVSAEVKLLVLMGIGEKSGIHVDGTDSSCGWHGFFEDDLLLGSLGFHA